jgi:hypothetical protein
MVQQVLFNGGESLTIAASGAEVPAFSKAITAPASRRSRRRRSRTRSRRT